MVLQGAQIVFFVDIVNSFTILMGREGSLHRNDLGLHHAQIWRVFQRLFHQSVVFLPIGLNPFALHCRAFAKVECAGLQSDAIGGKTHLAAQSVNFIHQVPLCGSANGGVAGHIGNAIQREGEQNGVNAHARACQRRFNAGVPRANDGNCCF